MDYHDAYNQLIEILRIEELTFHKLWAIKNWEDSLLNIIQELFSIKHPISKRLTDGFRNSRGLFYTPKNKSFSIDISDIFKCWNSLLIKQKQENMKIHDYELMNEIYMDLKNYLTSTNLDISDIMEITRDLDEDMSIEHITRKVQETCYVDKYSKKYHNDAERNDAEWDFNELI